jgi:hypothetical protein
VLSPGLEPATPAAERLVGASLLRYISGWVSCSCRRPDLLPAMLPRTPSTWCALPCIDSSLSLQVTYTCPAAAQDIVLGSRYVTAV